MSDDIKPFPEKEIRRQIIKKIKPKIPKSRSKHSKGYIYLNGIEVSKVKIPNDHDRIMKRSKSVYIAGDLKLNPTEFNDLIECPLKGPKYYKILSERV
jgi:hypothetical protein